MSHFKGHHQESKSTTNSKENRLVNYVANKELYLEYTKSPYNLIEREITQLKMGRRSE